MSLGLFGAQGTGKTTLAQAFATKENWTLVPSVASACFRELDLPYIGLSFEDRLRVQELILKRMNAQLWSHSRSGNPWIADRTPLDLAAYLLAEWGQRCDDLQGEAIMDYVDRCYKMLNTHYAMVVLIQPGIAYVDDGSRPPLNVAFQELHNMLCQSLVRDRRALTYAVQIHREATDLNARVAAVRHFWESNLRQAVRAEGVFVN